MFAAVFFPPTYFPPTFYCEVGADAVATSRDRDVFDALFAAVQATGEFPQILRHQDLTKRDASVNPAIAIKRVDWSEGDVHGQGAGGSAGNRIGGQFDDGEMLVRTVRYQVLLSHIDEDPPRRFDVLDRLENVFLDVADGTSIGGITWPFWTFCAKGKDDPKAVHPEGRVILDAQFSYGIGGYAAHDTTQ